MSKRSLNEISSDIMLVQNSFELTEQEIDEQLDLLHTELHEKENGVYDGTAGWNRNTVFDLLGVDVFPLDLLSFD